MADSLEHCPFLNRTDPRCAEHFRLDGLDHAFRFCFDRYRSCPLFVDLLVERRVRQVVSDDAREPIVQITLPPRYAKSAA
jgi:hypothetical protein